MWMSKTVFGSSMFRKISSRRCIKQLRSYHEVSFASHGEPSAVLAYEAAQDGLVDDGKPTPLSDSTVRVEMLHAPWNPADVNTVQGKYPSPYKDSSARLQLESISMSRLKPERQVAGSGGLGIVTHVTAGDSSDSKLQVGDVVVVGVPGIGSLRSSVWAPSSCWIPLKEGKKLIDMLGAGASTLSQLGGTALRMLRDFVTVPPGEVILQNAGNSGVGFMVSQLGTLLHDAEVVSLVRRGNRTEEQWSDLVDHLVVNGNCTRVVAEEDLTDTKAIHNFQSELRDLSASNELPMLGLNAVGGDSASIVSRCLADGGTMVTYGGMSMRPVTTSTTQFIFKNIRLVGYWHSRWMLQNSLEEQRIMLEELSTAVLQQGLRCPPVTEFPLSQVLDGLAYDGSQTGLPIRHKVVFQCQ